jgi:hypothetical protein
MLSRKSELMKAKNVFVEGTSVKHWSSGQLGTSGVSGF